MRVKISIYSTQNVIQILADDQTKEFKYDGLPVNDDVVRFVNNVVYTIIDWPEYQEDNTVLDGVKFTIICENQAGKFKRIGINKLPEDFDRLIQLINAINGVTHEQ